MRCAHGGLPRRGDGVDVGGVVNMGGYYDLYQLGTVRETERRKGHRGLFPWHPETIKTKVKNGTFPAPMKLGRKNVWKEEDIDAFKRTLEATAPVVPASQALV